MGPKVAAGKTSPPSPLRFLLPAALTAFLAWTSAARTSVTVDEFGNLPAGLAILQSGAYHIDAGSPPLSKTLAALPPFLLGSPKLPSASELAEFGSSWQAGARFMLDNAGGYHRFFMQARLASIGVLLAACLLAVGFARSLYGPAGGWLCAGFVFFVPDLLAHGRLVTTDVYLAAAMVAALWAFDAFLRRPGPLSAAALGAAVGAGVLCKFTAVLMFVLLPACGALVVLLRRLRRGEDNGTLAPGKRLLAWAPAAFASAVLAIHAGYAFHGSFTTLGSFEFTAPALGALQRMLPGWLPVFLPADFVWGLEAQLSETGYAAYLMGVFNQTGFWNYYVVGFLVKTPLPLLLGVPLAALLTPRLRLREVPLVAVSGVLFAFFSLAGHKNIGVRYLLFLVPLACVWTGRVAASKAWSSTAWGLALRWAAWGGAGCMVLSALLIWPDYLAYFNRVSGGPAAGHRYLLDSNLDWGQELIGLRRYLREQNIAEVDLAYFGRVRPEIYGIKFRDYFGGPVPKGPVVISANLLWGRMYFVNGKSYWPPDPETYAAFRRIKPRAVIGHSLYVFDGLP